MKITQRFRNAINSFSKESNSVDVDGIANKFLRYGNQKPMVQDWSKVVMSDKDLYVGYPYAAINNRANKLSQLATTNVKTDASKSIEESAKKEDSEVTHPYIEIINKSKEFSNYQFWYTISTYLDLEGVFYLMAVRNKQGERNGNIQEFKLLNPYNVRRIRNKETFEIGGYIEVKDGKQREIPVEMIIDLRKLNPFDDDDPYAMTDAAKENQFTLKQAGDYTRHSLKNNMASPGIISTDMLLEPQQFQNFVSRVTNQEKGIPLFGNGAGAITWDAMQIDLDKAGLSNINEINRSTLFAVSGVGKTMMGIEESGTTRETSKVQKDLFVENHIMPQLQLILDAFNQDYKNYYEEDYKKNEYTLVIDNPLGSDMDTELKDIEVKTKSLELYGALLSAGYDKDISAKYVSGEIDIDELGEPKNPPVEETEEKETKEEETKEEVKTAENIYNIKTLNYNKNHDEASGRFTSGGGTPNNGNTETDASDYPGRLYKEPFETYGRRYIKEHPRKALKTYKERILAEFNTSRPNVVSADDAKFIIPGFKPERSADYHEPGSEFAKDYYKALLADKNTMDMPVTFTAGGTGAGKSTALRGTSFDFNDYAAVYDGNMAGYDSAKGKIQQALDTGRKVEVNFIDRNPVVAFEHGVIPRIKKEGRLINISTHMGTHFDSREAVVRLSETFKDNPNVTFKVIDNSGPLGSQTVEPVSFLTKTVYNRNRTLKEIQDVAKKAKDDGTITESVYEKIINKNTSVVSGKNGSKSKDSRFRSTTKRPATRLEFDKKKQDFLELNGLEKFIKKYNGKLTKEELNLYIELE